MFVLAVVTFGLTKQPNDAHKLLPILIAQSEKELFRAAEFRLAVSIVGIAAGGRQLNVDLAFVLRIDEFDWSFKLVIMESLNISDFKARCLSILDMVARTG